MHAYIREGYNKKTACGRKHIGIFGRLEPSPGLLIRHRTPEGAPRTNKVSHQANKCQIRLITAKDSLSSYASSKPRLLRSGQAGQRSEVGGRH